MQQFQILDPDDKDLIYSSVKSKYSSKKFNKQDDQVELNQNFEASPPLSQESLKLYNHLLSEIQSNHRSFQDLIQQIEVGGISFNEYYSRETQKQKQTPHLRIEFIKNTKHFQIVTLRVSLGPFSQSLNVYNTFGSPIFCDNNSMNYSRATNIYRFNSSGKKYISKSISFSSNQSNFGNLKRQEFMNVVNEYFIAKIMSVLKIGPKLAEQLGFDIFLSKTDAFFFIQQCKTATEQLLTAQEALNLKINLKEMHSLSILHRDVKPDNIMYSPTFKKYVFIDFGMSEYRKEQPGQFIYTNFGGTYAYCTQEMKTLFKNREKSWVDLHLNDAHGLQTSIKEMKNIKKPFNQSGKKEKINQNKPIKSFLKQIQVKYIFFILKSNKISDPYEEIQHIPEQIYPLIMTFLYEIPLTQQIRKIYHNFLQQYAKNQDEFEDLKEIFQGKIYFESCKGKRVFSSVEEQKEIKDIQKFYEGIYLEYSSMSKLKRISFKNLEQILLTVESIEDFQQNQYELYLIEYLNCKKIHPIIPFDRKLEVCKRYINIKQLSINYEITETYAKQVLEFIFHQILSVLTIQWKVNHFFMYLKALENYFIFTENIDIEIMKEILQILDFIEKNDRFSYLRKSQKILLICLSLSFFLSPICYTVEIYSSLNKIYQSIREKASFYASNSMKKNDRQVCKFYVTCLSFLSVEYHQNQISKPQKLIEQIDLMNPQSQYSFRLLRSIQNELLLMIEHEKNVHFQRNQIEAIIYEEMEKDKQINGLLIYMIAYNYPKNEVKSIKKSLTFFDSCIRIEKVCKKYFQYVRLFALTAEQNLEQTSQKEKEVEILCQQIQALIEVKKQTVIVFYFQYKSFLFFYSNTMNLIHQHGQICDRFYKKILEHNPQAVHLYETLGHSMNYKGSKNLIYLDLIQVNIDAEDKLKLTREHYLKQKSKKLPLTKNFRKLINLDRSNFIEEDHAYILQSDIIWLNHSKGPNSTRQILDYLIQRKKFLRSMFTRQKTPQKTHVYAAFRMALYYLTQQKDIQMVEKGMNFMYQITKNKFSFEIKSFGYKEQAIALMIKLGRFYDIIDEIMDTSKMYSDKLTYQNTIQLSKFYLSTIKQMLQVNEGKDFFFDLQRIFPKIDLKKTPVFSIFLIFCIRPFNQSKILKHLLEGLRFLRHNGKYLILCKFYKELMKVKNFQTLRKRRFLLKNDVRYPSEFMKNLEEMKHQLSFYSNFTPFSTKHRQILDQKIIKLGRCCEVYSPKKMVHPLNEILSHQFFDKNEVEQLIQDWQKEEY